jgi:signal transduction histidine kinase
MGFTSAALGSLLDHLQRGQWDARAGASATYAIGGPEPVYINRYIAPVKDDQGAVVGLLLVFLDQTEEQELAQAREALSQMIVHDLRSPLTAVTTSLKLLHDLAPAESDFTPIVRRTSEASSRAVRKLLNLVDSLLDIARMESGRMRLDREPVHLAAVTSGILDEMHTLADELEVTLRAQIPEDLPLLDVDRDQIERVLLNLVDNAL